MLKRLLKEPMVYFCIIGALVYYFYVPDITDKDLTDSVVQLPSRFVDAQKDKFSQQYQRQPSEVELQNIIDQEVNAEILFREAWRLQLYVGDAVVKKRMIQKMQFLLEEGSATKDVSDEDVEAYFLTHQETFLSRSKVDLYHVLFSQSLDAERHLEQLMKADGRSIEGVAGSVKGSVAFPLGNVFTQISEEDVAQFFGEIFSENLGMATFDLTRLDQWQGPVKSRYGFHVVKLSNLSKAKEVSFSDVRDSIRKKLIETNRSASRRDAVEAVKQRYQVKITD